MAHRTVLDVARVPSERLVEQVGCLPSVRSELCSFKVVLELGSEIWMHAVVDDLSGTAPR